MTTFNSITTASASLVNSFIPGIIKREYSNKPELTVGNANVGKYAALLWVDICDFSTLSREIVEIGGDGLEQLSKTLVDHYDPLLKLIDEHGGEPVLFAGDGLLNVWFSDTKDLDPEIKQAMAVGQKAIADNKVVNIHNTPIKLHVVVACGTFHLLEIKDYEEKVLISPLGNSLTDLRVATSSRAPGQVLLSQNVISAVGSSVATKDLDEKTKVLDENVNFQMLKSKKATEEEISSERFLNYIPVSVHYQLDSDRIKWLAELRPVTILYVQLSGFDPDSVDSAESLKNAVKIASEVVYRNEGILGQVWIDEKDANLLIYFGPPPTAHRDNPYRGVNTAASLNNALSNAGFNVSIGVVSGTNFCGLIGNDIFRQYAILGDIVTLGARLARIENRGVWCDDATYSLTKKSVNYADYVSQDIKGAAKSVKAWEPIIDGADVIGKNSIDTIGRLFELQLMMNEWERISKGGRGAFILEGESGLGKSKLLDDFVSGCIAKGACVLQGKPERIGSKIPYQALRNAYTTILGVDNISDKKTKMETVSKNLGEEFFNQASLLNVVLQLDFPESEQLALLSGMQKSGATRVLLLKLLKKYTEQQALILVIDDAQWMDDASWSLTAEISRQIKGCFIICSLQHSEAVPGCRDLLSAGATKYQLRALSDDFQEQLIAQVLEVDSVSMDISETIKNVAKGNPFFCIELTRALLDEKSIVCDNQNCEFTKDSSQIKLPQTIKGAVRRKIDLLDPGPEMALKVASVAGHRFSTDLVQNVYPIERERDQVPNYLDQDSKLGLINYDVVDNLEEYTFNHSVTREVAYEALLRDQRVPLHRETAIWFENTFAGNLSPHFARIAYHSEQAGQIHKAVDYLEKEAIRLFSLGYPKESVDIGLQAAQLLDVMLDTDPQKIGPKIGENMGVIGALMAGRHPTELLDHKNLDNKETEKLLWLLLGIAPFAFQSQQIELFALISVTCLRITLEQGNGAPAPYVYSMYSAIHRGLTGNRIEANAWSQFALDLDHNFGGALHARIAFVHTWFHNHWRQPLASSLPISKDAAERGFDSGDFLFGCFNLSGHVVYQAATGVKLGQVISTAREFLEQNGRKVVNAAFHLIHEMQLAKAFAGMTENPFSLTDDEFDEGKDIASICETEFGNQIGYYLVSRIKLHQHFGDWKGALDFADEVQPLLPAIEGQVAEVDYLQYKTLAQIKSFLENEDSDIKAEVESNIDIIKSWAGFCSHNFAHKAMLLEGLYVGMFSDYENGMTQLENAALKAEDVGYLNDLGLAYEFQLQLQDHFNKEKTALAKAINAYKQWGAAAKVNYLQDKYSS